MNNLAANNYFGSDATSHPWYAAEEQFLSWALFHTTQGYNDYTGNTYVNSAWDLLVGAPTAGLTYGSDPTDILGVKAPEKFGLMISNVWEQYGQH